MTLTVRKRVFGINELPHIELFNDNLKIFDDAWERILMALDKAPEEDCLEGLYHRQLEKSTVMQRALTLCFSDRTHREEPKSYSKLRGMVTDVLEY